MDPEKGMYSCTDVEGGILMMVLKKRSVVKMPRKTLRELYLNAREPGSWLSSQSGKLCAPDLKREECDAWMNPSRKLIHTNRGVITLDNFDAVYFTSDYWRVIAGGCFWVDERDRDIEVTPLILGNELREKFLMEPFRPRNLLDIIQKECNLSLLKKRKRESTIESTKRSRTNSLEATK